MHGVVGLDALAPGALPAGRGGCDGEMELVRAGLWQERAAIAVGVHQHLRGKDRLAGRVGASDIHPVESANALGRDQDTNAFRGGHALCMHPVAQLARANCVGALKARQCGSGLLEPLSEGEM